MINSPPWDQVRRGCPRINKVFIRFVHTWQHTLPLAFLNISNFRQLQRDNTSISAIILCAVSFIKTVIVDESVINIIN